MGLLLRVTVVAVGVLVVQVELFSDTRVFGVMPELLLGAAIAAGWAGGPERGAVAAFAFGLLYDLFLPTPLALTAMTYVLIAFVVGLVSTGVGDSGERALRGLVSVVAVAAGIGLFVLVGGLLGEAGLYSQRLITIIVVASLYTAAFMPLLHRVMAWAFGASRRGAPAPTRMSMVE